MILSPSPARRPNTQAQALLLLLVDVPAPRTSGLEPAKAKPSAPSSTASVTMERVSFWSMFACLAGYLAVGVFAYAEHPDVPSNLLDAYPADDLPMLAASLFMGLSCVASYPINHFASRAALDDVYVAGVCAWKRCFAKNALHPATTIRALLWALLWARRRRRPVRRRREALHADSRVRRVHDGARARRGRPRSRVSARRGHRRRVVIFILPGILLLLPGYHGAGSAGVPSGGGRGAVGEPDEESGDVGFEPGRTVERTRAPRAGTGPRWATRSEGTTSSPSPDTSRRASLNAGGRTERTAAWKEPGVGRRGRCPEGRRRWARRWCARARSSRRQAFT